MSEKKDHLIAVLTETVETQKTVIKQLEDTAGYNEAKIRALEDEKDRLKDNFILVFESNKSLVAEIENNTKGKLSLYRKYFEDIIYDKDRIIMKYENESLFQFLKRKLWI